jgi:hypothetical protein
LTTRVNSATQSITNITADVSSATGSITTLTNNLQSVTSTLTTATSLNTPNTLVLRDGSGNFNAGTITANIIGNVTGNLNGNATTATNASIATSTYKLTTPRSIYGSNFDGTAALSGVISPTYGGTGIDNGNKTISLGGNLATTGAFNTTLTTTAATNITLPTTGTLATLTGAETLSSKTFSGTTTFNGIVTVSGTNTLTTGGLVAGGTTYPSTTGTAGQVLMLTNTNTAAWVNLNEQIDETSTGSYTGSLSAVNAGQTSFTLTRTPITTLKVKMYINGILISAGAYSVSGTTITYNASNNGGYSISTGDRVQFIYFY